VITEDPRNYGLDEYVAANKTNLKAQITDAQILEEKDATIGDKPGKALVYTFAYGNYHLKNTAYILVNNGKGYVITCSALETSFDRFQSKFREILSSFRIND
jgi:hypothetical protein